MVLVSYKLINDCRYHVTGMGVVTDFDASVLLRQRPHVKPMCSSLIISGRLLDYIARVQLEFGENSGTFRLTLG
jgi:hypothetical protein